MKSRITPISEAIRLVCVSFLLVHSVTASEVNLPAPSEGDLRISADVSSFFLRNGTRFEEISFRFATHQFEFRKQASGKFLARYEPNLEIRDASGNVVKELRGSNRLELSESETREKDRLYYDMVQVQLPPGSYTARLRILDLHSGKSGTRTFPIDAESTTPGRLIASDIYIASTIDARETNEIFQKGNHAILPNPTREVFDNRPLFFHIEIDNIRRRPHTIRFRIQDRFGHDLWDDFREYPGYRNRVNLTEGIPLRDYLSGSYTLIVEITAGEDRWESRRQFRLDGREARIPTTFDDRAVSRAKRILTEFSGVEAAATFGQLDRKSQVEYLYNHWRSENGLVASLYVAPILEIGRHEIRQETLGALGIAGRFKKLVDPVYAGRIPQPDSSTVNEAVRIVEFAKDADEDDVGARVARSVLYICEGNFPRAEADLNRLRNREVTQAEVYNGLGLTKLGRKDWKGAARHFKHARTLAPNWRALAVNFEIARFLDGGTDGEDELDVLRNAIIRDDTHPELCYMTGRKLEFEGELDQAESVYKRQIAVNPQHGRAEFDLARVWYKLEKRDQAIALWRELMGSRPELFHDCVLPLLEAYQVTDGMAGAQNLISEVLRSVGDTTRALLEDIQWVASPDETKAYAATPDERKEVYVRAFWQRRDPAPATPGNERLVEHYRRVLYAMRQFGEYQQPWDRRGDIYIRYGEPTHKSSRGNVRFETDPGVVNVRERLWQSLHLEARKEIIARANRLQATTRHIRINDRGGSSIDISDFEDGEFELDPKRAFRRASSLRDNFVYRSGVRLNTRDPGVDTENWRGYPTFPIDGAVRWEYWVYPNVAGGIEIDFVALSSGAPFDYPEIPQDWELSNYNVGTWNQRRPSLIVAKAVSRQPDTYNTTARRLDFHTDTADFQSRSSKSRFEIYYGIPVKDLVEDGRTEGVLELGVAIFDSLWAPIYRKVSPLSFKVEEGPEVLAGTLLIDEIALNLPAGKYHLGVQVNDPDRGVRGAYFRDIEIESYEGDGLKLSDLEMAGKVIEEEGAFKGGLEVIPLPPGPTDPASPSRSTTKRMGWTGMPLAGQNTSSTTRSRPNEASWVTFARSGPSGNFLG